MHVFETGLKMFKKYDLLSENLKDVDGLCITADGVKIVRVH